MIYDIFIAVIVGIFVLLIVISVFFLFMMFGE